MSDSSLEFDGDVFERTLIALAASAAHSELIENSLAVPDTVLDIEQGGSFVIPVLLPEEVESGDGRTFEKGSLTTRDLPIPLLWQVQTGDGHDGSVIVGRIDHVERIDDDEETELNGLGNAYGVFDTGPYGQEAERLVRQKFARGISADLDQFEASVENAEDTNSSDEDSDEEDTPKDIKDKIKSDTITATHARVMAATLVPKPAFQECTIIMADELAVDDQEFESLPDGVYEEEIDDEFEESNVLLAAIAASAAPVKPPKSWFDQPILDGPTPITVNDDGQVFGHIATWDSAHIGHSDRRVKPPRSKSNYAYFKTGVVRTEDGDDVAVGQLTLAGGHASLQADASAAVKHYDDTASGIADVTAGEDKHGIWVAGALRPGTTPEQVRVLRASAPSGDWRPINGRLELVAVCQVNVPGFPVTRAMVASGQITALVAAGARSMYDIREKPMQTLETRVNTLETERLAELRELAKSKLTPTRTQRTEALVAAADAARERLRPARERREALVASADEARLRVAALRVAPRWDESKHPRDNEGKFRHVLMRLSDILSGVDGAAKATEEVSRAADAEDAGNPVEAEGQAHQAQDTLRAIADNVTDPASRDRIAEAEMELDKALASLTEGVAGADSDELFTGLLNWFIAEVVSKVDPTQAIRNAPKELRRFLDGKEFTDAEELASYLQELIRRQVSPI